MIPRRRLPLAWSDLRVLGSRTKDPAGTIAAFEDAIAAYLGRRHVMAVASGRDALGLILDALGLGRGDEIIVPAYTLAELLPLLQRRGLVCVPADIDPLTFNVTAASIVPRIGPRTRAILVLHQAGAPCDISPIVALAHRHGLPLIEDCAHAAGARVRCGDETKAVGSFGHAAFFSLEANKAISAFGGGLVVTDDDALARRIRTMIAGRPRRRWPVARKYLLRCIEEIAVRSPLYGPTARFLFAPQRAAAFEARYRRAHEGIRVPGAFTDLQARWALPRLERLDRRNALLNGLAREICAGLPKDFVPQQRDRHGDPAFYQLLVRVPGDVVALRHAAHRHGIDLAIRSEILDDCASLLGYRDCPVTAEVFRDTLAIPCWEGMGHRTVTRLLDGLDTAWRTCR